MAVRGGGASAAGSGADAGGTARRASTSSTTGPAPAEGRRASRPDLGELGLGAHLRTHLGLDGEEQLVEGEVNEEDKKIAQDILYASEIREFLLFSLSKDIQTEDEADLRRSIEQRDPNLYLRLKAWFKENAYADSTESPVEFVNKVRTPCGQYTDKKACSSSSLCGWHKNTCKIRVKPVVDKKVVLRDLARTLLRNDKQRALVLDGRLSPFFSTVLYLEMPHEWITTSV